MPGQSTASGGSRSTGGGNGSKSGSGKTNGSLANGTTTDKPKELTPAQKREQASQDMTDLESALKKFFRSKDFILDMTGTLAKKDAEISELNDKCSNLVLQLSAKDEEIRKKDVDLLVKDSEITRLEEQRKQTIKDHEDRTLEFDSEKKELKKELTDAKATAIAGMQRRLDRQADEHQRDLTAWQKKCDEEKLKTAAAERQFDNANMMAERVKGEKAYLEQKLKVWEDVLRKLGDLDLGKFENDFGNQLSVYLETVEKHFTAPLPQDVLDDPAKNWDNLPQTLSLHKTPLPLVFPPTNSPAARSARHLAALSILSELLTTMILTPSYVPQSAVFSRVLTEILDAQHQLDPEMDKMTRALLLATYSPTEIDDHAKQVVKYAAREASARVGVFLSDGGKAFRGDLERLFQGFADLWKRAQRSRKRIQASVYENTGKWDWEEMEFAGPQEDEHKGKVAMLNLFPRVWWVSDGDLGARNGALSQGFMAYTDQVVIIQAEREWREWREELERRAAATQVGPGRGGDMWQRVAVSVTRRKRASSTMGGSVLSTSPKSPRPDESSFLGSVDPVLPRGGGRGGEGGRGVG